MFRNSAHVYDLIYEASGKDYAAEAAGIHDAIQARNPGATRLLDVACGTGGHIRHLRAHYSVVGVDLDPGMLAEATQRNQGIEFVESDMRTLELKRTFDAVICLFSSIGYMQSVDELDQAIAAMARHLAPGGVLIVDGWVRPEEWRAPVSFHMEVADGDDTKAARIGRSRREGNKTILEMEYLVGSLEGIEHLVDRHELTLFTDDEYRAAFAAVGLSVDVVTSPMAGRDRYIGIR